MAQQQTFRRELRLDLQSIRMKLSCALHTVYCWLIEKKSRREKRKKNWIESNILLIFYSHHNNIYSRIRIQPPRLSCDFSSSPSSASAISMVNPFVFQAHMHTSREWYSYWTAIQWYNVYMCFLYLRTCVFGLAGMWILSTVATGTRMKSHHTTHKNIVLIAVAWVTSTRSRRQTHARRYM